jgi:glycerol kinase
MNRGRSYLLGIDQGTSGSRALILDDQGGVCGYGYRPLPRLYPQPGWVEQDVHAVVEGTQASIAEALEQAGIAPDELRACGIACQRNTDFVWERASGQALSNAITWQDLRSEALLPAVNRWAPESEYRRRLGRDPGAFSSALHLAWRMRNQPAFAQAARAGTLRIGFSANWLLTAMGKPAAHQMDYSLVQAMGLYDFRRQDYWDEWLEFLELSRAGLPEAVPTTHEFGALVVESRGGRRAEIPLLAMLGDQQGALFGYDCRRAGDGECTHGTASFIDVCLGGAAPEQAHLNVYYAWHLGDRPTYCIEADTTVTGAALRWLREGARLIDREDEIGPLAASVPDSGGVFFVPAFTGLNIPYHDSQARAALFGLTLGASRAHIARAFLESIGFQIQAILETIRRDLAVGVDRLHVGGGLSASDLACQIQADLTGIPIIRPAFTQTTARAAALLAGLKAGVWQDLDGLPRLPGEFTVFEPALGEAQRREMAQRWEQAIEAARQWKIPTKPDQAAPG